MGTDLYPAWITREILPSDPQYLDALQLALTSQPRREASHDPSVLELVSQGETRAAIRPVVGSFAHRELAYAVAGVEAGGSVLLLIPFELVDPALAVEPIRLGLTLARCNSVSFAQVIAPSVPSKWDDMLSEAGFSWLTELVYLTRSIEKALPANHASTAAADLTWRTYSDQTAARFQEAVERSYEGSMDCPELLGLRSSRQSLDSHRAAGSFDPQFWFLLECAGEPLGVLLLARLRREPLIEVVYMGVTQAVRRNGVANILLEKAVQTASTQNANLILAVDVRNTPARRLYGRWGFEIIARRSAWIAKLVASEC